MELANELECKWILNDLNAFSDLGALLKSTESPVLENTLAVLGFASIVGRQNAKQAEVRLSLTSFEPLQDDASKCDLVPLVVNLVRSQVQVVHNQAVCTLASLCLRHTINSAKAAAASAVDALVKLLTSNSEVIKANVIHALLAVRSHDNPDTLLPQRPARSSLETLLSAPL